MVIVCMSRAPLTDIFGFMKHHHLQPCQLVLLFAVGREEKHSMPAKATIGHLAGQVMMAAGSAGGRVRRRAAEEGFPRGREGDFPGAAALHHLAAGVLSVEAAAAGAAAAEGAVIEGGALQRGDGGEKELNACLKAFRRQSLYGVDVKLGIVVLSKEAYLKDCAPV